MFSLYRFLNDDRQFRGEKAKTAFRQFLRIEMLFEFSFSSSRRRRSSSLRTHGSQREQCSLNSSTGNCRSPTPNQAGGKAKTAFRRFLRIEILFQFCFSSCFFNLSFKLFSFFFLHSFLDYCRCRFYKIFSLFKT